MKSTVEVVSATQVRLVMEAPFEELEPDLSEACAGAGAGRHGVAGFGKGRLPFQAIDQRAGGTVLPRDVEEAILALICTAEREHEVKPLGRAEVEIIDCGDGRPLRFTAVVDVRPAIDLPELSSIIVAVDSVTVDDSEIDTALEMLRERFATLEDVDRPAADGDVVHINVYASVDGVEVSGSRGDGIAHEVGAGRPLAGLDTAVVGIGQLPAVLDGCLPGLSAGGSTAVLSRLVGGELAGCDADVAVTVTAVKTRRLPELDDDFVSRAGKVATLNELRGALREWLSRAKETARLQTARDDALRQITAAAAVPAPDGLVHDEVEYRRQWMLAELNRLGTSLTHYLTTGGKTEEHLDEELRGATTQRIRSQLVVDAFADAENLQVSDEEVGEMIAHRARQAGIPPQTYYSQLARNGGGQTVVRDLRRAKALSLIMQRVTINDTDGNPLTLHDLRGVADNEGHNDTDQPHQIRSGSHDLRE